MRFGFPNNANLEGRSENLRVSEIGRLVAEMHANGEDRQTVEAFSTPSDIATCEVVAGILLERYGVRVFET